MMCLAFTLALAFFFERRMRGGNRAIPLLAAVITGLIGACQVKGLVSLFGAVAHVNAADKPTLLAAYISEALDWRWLLVQAGGLGLAVGLDLLVRRRHAAREPWRATPPPPPPPPGTGCQLHPGVGAVLSCARCGSFACAECRGPDGLLCAACDQRKNSR